MKTKIVSRLIQLLGLYFFFTSAYMMIGNIYMIQYGQKTKGKVISSYDEFVSSNQTGRKRSGTSRYIKRPIIQYHVGEEAFEVNGEFFGNVGDEYQVGQSVDLYYLFDNPSYSVINSFCEMWYRPIKTMSFSITIFLFGTFLSTFLAKLSLRKG